MKIFRILTENKEKLCIEGKDGNLYLTDEMGFDFKNLYELILAGSEVHKTISEIVSGKIIKNLHPYDPQNAHILSPVSEPMQNIICLGVNYKDHASEISDDKMTEGDEDEYQTIYFSKYFSHSLGSGDSIPSHPDTTAQPDYEAELLVIIKDDIKNVTEEEAQKSIFGYSVFNDISARDLQTIHKQWFRGKSLDGFTVIGPCVVTSDEIENVQNLEIGCYVNGEERQKSNTSYMIKNVCAAIAELSEGMTLKAGTLIATGTPAGTGKGMKPPCYLRSGDKVLCYIEDIGTIENIVK